MRGGGDEQTRRFARAFPDGQTRRFARAWAAAGLSGLLRGCRKAGPAGLRGLLKSPPHLAGQPSAPLRGSLVNPCRFEAVCRVGFEIGFEGLIPRFFKMQRQANFALQNPAQGGAYYISEGCRSSLFNGSAWHRPSVFNLSYCAPAQEYPCAMDSLR